MATISKMNCMIDTQVVFLNGASSSGKTSLARALQCQLEQPFIHFAEDMFFSARPIREYSLAEDLYYGSRLYNGFTQCVRTMVNCDNRVIVDTVAWTPGSLAGYVIALWDINVFAVGIHCAIDILENRERQRKDRPIGLAKRQNDLVHRNALYDLEIDTSNIDIDMCAKRIVNAVNMHTSQHAFAQMKHRIDDGWMV